MYYEVYVDLLFLINFTMDYVLLLLTGKLLKCTATHGSVFCGAILGAFFTCVIIVLPLPAPWMKLLLFHLFVNLLMVRAGLRVKDWRNGVKAWIMLYAGGFMLGGVMEHLKQYVHMGSLFLFLAVTSYYIVLAVWKFLEQLQQMNRYRCRVELYLGENTFRMNGLIDTGNQLSDPYTGEAVCILGKRMAQRILKSQQPKEIRYIPYHSIGKEEGVLLSFRMDKMCICEEHMWIERPLVAISEEELSAGETYELLLNPEVLHRK